MAGTTGVTVVVSDGVGATHGYGTTGVMEDTTDTDGVVTMDTAGAVTAGAVTVGAVTAGAVTATVMVMVMAITANTVITEVEEGIITTIQLPVMDPQEI